MSMMGTETEGDVVSAICGLMLVMADASTVSARAMMDTETVGTTLRWLLLR